MEREESALAQAGEFGFIARLTDRLAQGPGVLLGPGDDAAVITAGDRRVVASTDMLVEGRHFRRDWSSGLDVGHKAAAANLADIAAMGGRGTALLVGMCVPDDLPLGWAEDLADGLAAEAAKVDASVVGGDTVSGPTLTISVTALGELQGRAPVTRDHARPGDVLAVAGRLGWAAAGTTILSRGFRSPGALVSAHRRPQVPYPAGPVAAVLGATAMIDVSDGLLADLGHISARSQVAVDVDRAALEIPDQMRDAGHALGVDPYQWALAGGEDHALVATFPPGTELGPEWRVIGRVEAGTGVTVDGLGYAGQPGWDHGRS
ncbi:thiamine-phosphate kinase [Stackebrandtia albiflava]|uniref:thiamine-phosphate kinase n=1 Tax=Stackebrandtia albiflava TaxID=406432 RepID=UPI001B868C40|nr:thiamine-phosphate kinase [Stackebrandtia albiflava]